jgi:hypothetical protein
MIGTVARTISIAAILVGVLLAPVSSVAASASDSSAADTPKVATAAACHPGASKCPIRITFAKGAYSAQARSTLTGHFSTRWFSIKARAGQTLIVVVKGAGATQGIVYAPNGTHAGQPGGRVFDAVLVATGTYRIKVAESATSEGWHGSVAVLVVAY